MQVQVAYDAPDPKSEDATLSVPEESLLVFTRKVLSGKKLAKGFWAEAIHDQYVYVCATRLGISAFRASMMRDAAHMPDIFQSGLDNFYNQQWSHAFILTKTFWGPQWLWGDADDDFHDNIDGTDEGLNGKWAGYYYEQGNTAFGDWYLGYACHYIADVGFVLHASIPDADMALHHFDYETWVANNWTQGHNFYATASTVPANTYYSIFDLKTAIRNAAQNSNYALNTNAREAWNNYKLSGYPTTAGSGNTNAVIYTRKMVVEATKQTGGAIQYALNKYKQW